MPGVSQPVRLQVFAHIPTDFFHCSHCERLLDAAGIGTSAHREMQATYPPEVLQEAERLATWLQDLSARHGDQIHIRVVDPQSPEGFFKSLRYWVRRYPTFVVNRHTKYTGWEPGVLDRLLEEQVARGASTEQGSGVSATTWGQIGDKIRHAVHVAGEVVYGMTTFEWARGTRRERGEVERLFVLVTFGDLIGLPLLPPYYTLRLLPYIVPAINRWKRGLLRERDWTDLTGLIEGVD